MTETKAPVPILKPVGRFGPYELVPRYKTSQLQRLSLIEAMTSPIVDMK
jgi:hypothetical protein